MAGARRVQDGRVQGGHVLAGVALLALLAVAVHASRQHDSDSAALRQLADRVATLEAARAAPSPRPSTPSTRPYPPVRLARAAPALAPVPRDPALELAEQAQRGRELDAQFAAQPAAPRIDPVPQQVLAAFASDGVLGAIAVPRTRNVACRAQACLIQGTFAAGDDAVDWTTRLMLEIGETLPDYRTVDVSLPDGGHEIRIYAARPGRADR